MAGQLFDFDPPDRFVAGTVGQPGERTFYLQATGSRAAAEPFIGHFLWEYCCHFPDRDRAFRSITGRVSFQMGLTLLRIARNDWVDGPHRQRLIQEAKIILRTF